MNNNDKLKELSVLDITASGYEGLNYKTEVLTVDDYIKEKSVPYYAEFLVLPDGRIIPAEPSHSIVLDSLLYYLNDGHFSLSPTWLVEERLYYTGAITCWREFQNGFSELTKAQEATLEQLEKAEIIIKKYSCYNEEKQEFFLEIKDDVHKKAIEFEEKMKKSF